MEEDSLVLTPSSSSLGLAPLPPASSTYPSLSTAVLPSSSISTPVSASPSLPHAATAPAPAPSASASGHAHVLRGRLSARPPSTRRRTRLSSQERAKILEVRRQRACLRCKMLKIQCSKENPCKPCLSSAVRGYERKVLSFCYCVRTRFTDVDIFHRSEDGPPPEIPASIRALMSQVERPTLPPAAARSNDDDSKSKSKSKNKSKTSSPPSSSASASSSSASANPFEDSLIRWLTSPDHAPPDGTGSIVALLYDMVGNADSLRSAVDDRLPADFQTFLFTTSLAHTGWRSSSSSASSSTSSSASFAASPSLPLSPPSSTVTHRDLCVAGHVCGSRIVRRLDRILTPQFLAKCDRTTHRALLLLVFGVILGVSYSTRLTTSPSFPHDMLGAEMRHSPTLWLAMKEHLAQMLAHHLIFLGSTLGIKLDTAAEKTIIETAVNRWNKPERSLWAGIVGWVTPGAAGRMPKTADPGSGVGMMTARSFGTPMGEFGSLEGLDPQQQLLQRLSHQQLHQQLHQYHHQHHQHHQQHPHSSPSSPPGGSAHNTAMAMMSMVALNDPDLLELQAVPPMSEDDFSANPESYYSMGSAAVHADMHANMHTDMHTNLPASISTDLEEFQRGRPGGNGDGQPPTRKRRSVWIVRPYDDAGNREPVSVFARFQLQQGQNLGLFV
ncbi:hypothetical protein SCUCBS95973_007110 [Sporothrix curviconia]|uniref:Zn(2)-C6 fungal-type domain-containing protein n=1 Tax=Sporothrix curviconia TaxID=1260050 RepID=A0ABP0CBV5_9PEZI